MNEQEILATLTDVIERHFGCSNCTITRESTALDVDGWDSLSHVVLMVKIEKAFRIKFSDEDLFSHQNVGSLVDRIAQLCAASRGN